MLLVYHSSCFDIKAKFRNEDGRIITCCAKKLKTLNLITETERLQIMCFSPDDAKVLYGLTGDTDVMKYFPKILSYVETSQMLRKILDHYEQYGYCFWKVMCKSEAGFIGIAGILHQEIEDNIEAEVSYRIAKKHWNNGYGTEATKACMQYARTVLGKTRLISIIHPENKPSLRVAQKLGAHKEKSVSFIGTIHDVYVY
jgi:RimJ/RimL family protein N-acetyltransferase